MWEGDRSFLEQLAIEANLILFYCETTYFFVYFNCITYTDYHKLGTLTLKTGCIWPLLIILICAIPGRTDHTQSNYRIKILYVLCKKIKSGQSHPVFKVTPAYGSSNVQYFIF